MLNSIVRDYKAEAMEIYEKLTQAVWSDSYDYSSGLRKISEGFDKSEPSLMFYGIYNAGKSSLLNAVFGEEKASTGDIPETHRVTGYQWGKYTLVDTPGLNGPPEDEKITMQEVGQHDIIMFVIDDSDNFDSDVITKKIIEILETGKPCIIVINRKNDSGKEQVLAIKAKMNQNIRTLSPVMQNYEFVDVDSAVNGFAERIYQRVSSNMETDITVKEYEQEIQNLAQKFMAKFSTDSHAALHQFTEAYRLKLSLTDIPEEQRIAKIPDPDVDSKDSVDSLLDVLGMIPVLVPTPAAVPIPLPVIAGAVKILKEFIFGKDNRNVPDVAELNKQQEEYAQKRAMALRELRNQISIQMDDFKSKAEGAFKEQLEAAYLERSVNIDNALKEQDEKNADRSRKLELAAGLQNKAARLLEEIRKPGI